MQTLSQENVREAQSFIEKVGSYAGAVSDLDGTGYDSEAVAARVTARLTISELFEKAMDPNIEVDRVLRSAGTNPDLLREQGLSTEDLLMSYVCANYSGKSVENQVPLIEKDFGMRLHPEFVDRKKRQNIIALGGETVAIEGYRELLDFYQRHGMNFAAFTASPTDRVYATMRSSGLDSHLCLASEEGKFAVISAATPSLWTHAGREVSVPSLPHKPHGGGYDFMAREFFGLDPKYVIGLEDSATGVQAVHNAGLFAALVTMGTHFPTDGAYHGRVHALKSIVHPDRHVVVDHPRAWACVVKTHLALGLQNARASMVGGLPLTNGADALPAVVADYVDHHFHCTEKPVLSSARHHTATRPEKSHPRAAAGARQIQCAYA